MFVWHVCIILAVKALSSGRAAILGYTMPIFSAVIGALLFSRRADAARLAGRGRRRRWAWRCCCGTSSPAWPAGPASVALALVAAAIWALGTQLLRRSTHRPAHAHAVVLDDGDRRPW